MSNFNEVSEAEYNAMSEYIEEACILARKMRDLYERSGKKILSIGVIGDTSILLDTDVYKFFYGCIEGAVVYEDEDTIFYRYVDPETGILFTTNEANEVRE